MAVFIGKLIKEVIERRGITKTELGRRLNMSSTNVHKIFKRESIDTALLQKISEVLEHDFFSYYTSINNTKGTTNILNDSEAEYKKILDICRDKIAMLEKINALQDEKIQRLLKGKSKSK